MLNPMLPDEVAVKEIPSQRFSGLKELFAFRQFQGVVLVHKLHLFAQVLNVIWAVIGLVTWIIEERPLMIFVALITFPILVVFLACVIRVLSEMAISVLLVPSLLVKPAGAEGGASVNGVDADLAAYGVTANSGTIV